MFRKLWARMTGQEIETGNLHNNSSSNAVVPLRKPEKSGRDLADNLIVTKKDHVERLYDAIDQLVGKLEGIHTHLGSQVRQNEQLLEHIQKLPDVLSGVPESMSRQEQAINALAEQLRKKIQTDSQLAEKLSTLPDETSKQTAVLEEISKQIFASAQSEEAMSENFANLTTAVTKLDENTASQTDWIQKMNHSFTETDKYLKDTLARQQKRMLWVYVATVGICLLSVAGLVAVILIIRGGF